MENPTKVSIVCLTYNHEKYIAETIESFLTQKTNFNFEIIIHDDASTDGTVEILKQYEKKYPNLIKVIYQSKNLYSIIHFKFINKFIFPILKGVYTAFCEGDDCWIDSNKLQKQVDFMDQNLDCSMCANKALIVDASTESKIGYSKIHSHNNTYDFEKTLLYHSDINFASILYRTQYNNCPDICFDFRYFDFPFKLYLAFCGYIYLMNDCMSIYRRNSKESLTATWEKEATKQFVNDYYLSKNKFLDQFNLYTERKYDNQIQNVKKLNEITSLFHQKRFKEIRKNKEYRSIYKSYTNRQKLSLFLRQYFSWIIDYIKRKN